jgi:hypothetical protein
MINALNLARAERFALYATLLALLLPNVARAGQADEIVKIAPRPAGSAIIALASMYGGNGLVYSRDGGETFSVLCSQAFTAEIETSRGPDTVFVDSFEKLLVTHDGRVLVATPYGLWLDDGHGCGWELLPEKRTIVSALAHDPLSPEIIYGATANGVQQNGVFRRNADGTFDDIGEKSDFLIYSLNVVALPDGGRRFYKLFVTEHILVDVDAGVPVELMEGEIPPQGTRPLPSYTLAYSDDEGETWTSHELGPDLGGGSLRVEAVDPTNPDRLVISAQRLRQGGTPDLLLVSDDRGETRREWHTVMNVSAVTFAPDGEVWIADSGEGTVDRTRGLWHAASTEEEPELITDAYRVTSIEWRDGKLEASGFDRYGAVDLETGELAAAMTFNTLSAVHSCEGMDMVATCKQSFCTGRCKHWYEAPLCIDEYDATLESCGVVSSTGTGGGMSSGGMGGGMSSEGTGGMMSVSTPEPMADDAGTLPAARNDGGCSCRAIGGATDRSAEGPSTSALLVLALIARRRTRPHAAS